MSFAIFTPEAFPRCLDFLLFSIIPGYIIYIYRVSFLSKKIRRAIFVAGYVYLCVCFCVCVCGQANFPFSSLFENDG